LRAERQVPGKQKKRFFLAAAGVRAAERSANEKWIAERCRTYGAPFHFLPFPALIGRACELNG
jgi:hypothetical protein